MTTINPNGGDASLLTSAARSGAANGADFNMFLKLLTTQMQNQDPLDPMDTSEYTQQLVQYSQVEQSIQQTGALRDILARLSAQDMAQASAFIGREARFDNAVSGLGASEPAQWAVTPQRDAETLAATIKDASGRVLRELELDPSSARFTWDGTLANGSRAPEGSYSLSVVAKDAAGADVPVVVNSVGVVRDVVTEDGSVTLGVGGVRYPIGELLAVTAG